MRLPNLRPPLLLLLTGLLLSCANIVLAQCSSGGCSSGGMGMSMNHRGGMMGGSIAPPPTFAQMQARQRADQQQMLARTPAPPVRQVVAKPGFTKADTAQLVKASTVQIWNTVNDEKGSGIVIEKNRQDGKSAVTILTCSHQFDLKDEGKIVIKYANGDLRYAKLVGRNVTDDLAALVAYAKDDVAARPLSDYYMSNDINQLRNGKGQQGPIMVAGYDASTDEYKIANGELRGYVTASHDGGMSKHVPATSGSKYETTHNQMGVSGIDMVRGQSGGPMLDADGKVVGVSWGSTDHTSYGTGLTTVNKFAEDLYAQNWVRDPRFARPRRGGKPKCGPGGCKNETPQLPANEDVPTVPDVKVDGADEEEDTEEPEVISQDPPKPDKPVVVSGDCCKDILLSLQRVNNTLDTVVKAGQQHHKDLVTLDSTLGEVGVQMQRTAEAVVANNKAIAAIAKQADTLATKSDLAALASLAKAQDKALNELAILIQRLPKSNQSPELIALLNSLNSSAGKTATSVEALGKRQASMEQLLQGLTQTIQESSSSVTTTSPQKVQAKLRMYIDNNTGKINRVEGVKPGA